MASQVGKAETIVVDRGKEERSHSADQWLKCICKGEFFKTTHIIYVASASITICY